MKRRSWIIFGCAGALTAAALVWAFRPQPVPVETAEIRKGLFEQTVVEDGKTRVRERHVVSAPVAGRLARIGLKAGDTVKQGGTVAVLSPSAPAMIDARTARELTERVGAADAALNQARAKVARAEAALDQAQTDVARQQKLQKEGFVAAAALEQASLAARVQTKEVEAARFAQDGAAHDLEQARAALMRAREASGVRRPGTAWEIASPIDGHVLRVLQESETVVGIGTPLMEIGNPADLEIVIDVLSSDGSRIRTGARVDIDAGGGLRLTGRVRHVEPAAFTKVSALGIEEQRVNVIVDIVAPVAPVVPPTSGPPLGPSTSGPPATPPSSTPPPAPSLGDQFRIDARIIIFERPDVAIAPVAALLRDGEQWAVFVATEGRAQKRRVKVGGRTATDAWIEEGLTPGERVIVYPSDSVGDGKRLQVVRGPA